MATFPPGVIQAAVRSAQTWHIPASVTLAQWALESDYGKAMPPGSNNPFGIKAKAGEAYVLASTREVVNGKSIEVNAKFRKFFSLDNAFDDHGRLLATCPAYLAAQRVRNDANAFADALTGVYATDPHYGWKLKTIMQGNNLYQYDAPTGKTST
jgi:flagellum-specific peptidoglycan hydrolase FlgJ